MDVKRVAVIGAGVSGLCALKCCLEESMEAVCFERSTDIGGLWRYTEEVSDGQGSVMRSTVTNTSKEVMAYSDFPPPKEFPNYMHHTKVMEYYRLYADNFKLMPHIRFGVEVKEVKRSSDFEQSGRWQIELIANGASELAVFDAVLVCTGHHTHQYHASFPGEENFKGKKMHAHSYRNSQGFEGKKVVIIGLGNSGSDVGVDLSRLAKQVYMSTRGGAWVIPKLGNRGIPFDFQGIRRLGYLIPLPIRIPIGEWMLNSRFDHKLYGVKPDTPLFKTYSIVANDELPNQILNGSIVIKPNVERITESGVIFTDGSHVDDVDVIVYATGYQFKLPFIHDEIYMEDKTLALYKYIFPTKHNHNTLAFIGFVQPFGAINPVSEMQARLVVQVLKGCVKLPPRETMEKEIKMNTELITNKYYLGDRPKMAAEYVPYMDELSEMMKCKPDWKQLWLTDPKLASIVFFGACTPYQFRLMGPGAWKGAREAIMSQWDRLTFPLRGTRNRKTKQKSSIWIKMLLPMLFVYFVCMYLF